MNIGIILSALVLGFIAGVAGAVVAIEVKTDRIRKDIADSALAIIRLNAELRDLKAADEGLAAAIQKTIERMQRERAGIWESLNTLWKRYDDTKEEKEQEGTEEE